MNTSHVHSSATALIVEDEPIISLYLAEMLGDAGITAAIAGTAAEAMSLLQSQSFDLAFVDLGLPDRSGIEVIDAVQHDYPALPIVISTGFGDSVLRDSIIEQRHVHLLNKPYTPTDLNGVLMKCGLAMRKGAHS